MIEIPSNVKEIWSGHGIQAQTSVPCFDLLCTELLGNSGFPLTLKMTLIYALVISNKRTLVTLTCVKTMAVSPACHVLLCTVMFAFVYQMTHISLAVRVQCKKL